MTERQLDFPLDEVCLAADRLIKQGWDVHQKFTCAACGARQTMERANVMYTTGHCEECGAITDIAARGCNYMMTIGVPR